ncbi:vesicular-fusion protein S17 [Saitoella coloradoensis]
MADAQALLQKNVQADKKAASGGGGGFSRFFGGGTTNYEDAAELYVQAANAFKLQRMSKEAGQAFEKAAAMQLKTDEKDDAPNTLVEAYKVYRKTDPEDAARVMESAIQMYTAKGNFRRAATNKSDLAGLYELELNNIPKALEAYDVAGEWFSGDQAEALANKAWLKVGELAALQEDYARAIARFEDVARSSVSNNLTRYSVKEYFFKAGLCHIASGDLVATKRAFDTYINLDPGFMSTREFELLQDIVTALESADQELFTEKVFGYDQLSKLDKWKTTLLLKIKNGIEDEPDLT